MEREILGREASHEKLRERMNKEMKIIVFESKRIRRVWHEDDWWFSVVDVVRVLSGSIDPQSYWRKLKQRLIEEGNETVTKCHGLKMCAEDGKMRETDCANKQNLFRIIQSIPSKKAEPFKLWLAKVGSERIDEIENPELAQERMKELYEKKGYSKSWIDKRLRGIAIRQDLTDEWKDRGIKENKDFAILTDEIAKATFGVSIKEHKKIKDLDTKFKNQNLRDHMTDLELIFGMLGERVATEITQSKDSEGFEKCKDSAIRGGNVAGNARIEAEKEIGKSVISKNNSLDIKKKKLIRMVN